MKVRNMQSPTTGREVANQFVITDEETNRVTFQGYDSEIITIDRDKKVMTVGKDWDYSQTTGRYRNSFMEDQGFWEMATTKDFRKYLKAGKIDNFDIVLASGN